MTQAPTHPFLERLTTLGIAVVMNEEGDKLTYSSSKGPPTQALLAEMHAAKPALLAFFHELRAQGHRAGPTPGGPERSLAITAPMNPFETARQTREGGAEFWSARDLQGLLGYAEWRKFDDAVQRAASACENSGQDSREHFVPAAKTLPQSNQHGVFEREVLDYHLSRYACYLTAMNGDPRKPEIANAQTYFAVRTHEAEQRPVPAPPTPASALALSRALLEALEQQDTRVSAIEYRLDCAPITSERVGEIHRLGQHLGQVMGNYSAAWRLFKNRFGLASYRDLPSNRYDEAIRFLRVQISAYTGKPLPGEL
ncbi:hypothetical protein GCM10022631_10970 [Deinococcus rubellus]|uniref:BRO family protein n=1 Tax=Deinococcus rubellus TaxID=1889240 RepID=UPI0031F02375